MKLKSKWAVVLPRIVLRLWHSIWIAYWRERLDDAVTFTGTSGRNHAAIRYNHHVRRFNANYQQNSQAQPRKASADAT